MAAGLNASSVPCDSFAPSAITYFAMSSALVLALVPGLERDEHRRGVGLVGAGDDVEAADDEYVLDRGMAEQNLLHSCAGFLRALQRRAVGQCKRAEEIALVLRRHEAAGHDPEQQRIRAEDGDENEHRDHRVAHGESHAAEIGARQPGETAIERPEQRDFRCAVA